MAPPPSSSDDPRRPPGRPYAARPVNPEELPPDYMALASVLLGIVGLMLKYKACAWLALVACISSVATVRAPELDVKQVVCSITFALMGLVMNYLARSGA